MITQIQKDNTMFTEEIRKCLVAMREKAQDDYEKSMSEFRSYMSIWEALETIRDSQIVSMFNEAIMMIDRGVTAECLLREIDNIVADAENSKQRKIQLNFPSADLLELEYIIGGAKRARVRIRRILNPDATPAPKAERTTYDHPYKIPPKF